MFKFKRIMSILLVGFITATFTTGCPSGCKDEPLTAEQELVAKEMARASVGDFITTDAGGVFMVTNKSVTDDETLLSLDYCPGLNTNPKTTNQIARWVGVRIVPSGSDEYLRTLGAWVNQDKVDCYH